MPSIVPAPILPAAVDHEGAVSTFIKPVFSPDKPEAFDTLTA